MQQSNEIASYPPQLSGEALIKASIKAIHDWTNNSLMNWKSEAKARLALLAHATDENCYALLAGVLFGKGGYDLGSLKYFLLRALGWLEAFNNAECKVKIIAVAEQLENFLCHDLQYVKIPVTNLHQESIVYFLDKQKITSDSVLKAYHTFPGSINSILLVFSDNYKMQFRNIMHNHPKLACHTIESIFQTPKRDSLVIKAFLHDHLLYQDITDPLSDIHVLRPEYWQLVSAELDIACDKPALREIWTVVKDNMAIFNDKDTSWLYFPEEQVLKNLQKISQLSGSFNIKNLQQTRYLLDVLFTRSSKFDSNSINLLKKDPKNLKILYEKAVMNKFFGLVAQLEAAVNYLQIKPCICIQDREYFDKKLQFEYEEYNNIFESDNPDKLRLFLATNRMPAIGWRSWCAEAIIQNHRQILQVLIADKKLDEKHTLKDIEFICRNSDIDFLKLYCSLTKCCWLPSEWDQSTLGPKHKIYLAFVLFMQANFGKFSLFKGNELYSISFITELNDYYINTVTILLNKAVQLTKKNPFFIEKYGIFSTNLPLPREIKNIIVDNLAYLHIPSDFSKEGIKDLIPDEVTAPNWYF